MRGAEGNRCSQIPVGSSNGEHRVSDCENRDSACSILPSALCPLSINHYQFSLSGSSSSVRSNNSRLCYGHQTSAIRVRNIRHSNAMVSCRQCRIYPPWDLPTLTLYAQINLSPDTVQSKKNISALGSLSEEGYFGV